jgi:hypothetical protein
MPVPSGREGCASIGPIDLLVAKGGLDRTKALAAEGSVSGHEIRLANWTPASRVGIAL